MFKSKKNVAEPCVDNKTTLFRRSLALLQIGMVAMLMQSPVWATDPIDVDPDPDFASNPVTITIDASDQLDIDSLAPGHYLIVVIADDGSEHSFEVWVD